MCRNKGTAANIEEEENKEESDDGEFGMFFDLVGYEVGDEGSLAAKEFVNPIPHQEYDEDHGWHHKKLEDHGRIRIAIESEERGYRKFGLMNLRSVVLLMVFVTLELR